MCVRARTSPAGRSQTTRAASAATSKPSAREHVLEQQVLLEAVAAAAAVHELALERGEVEPAPAGPRACRGSRTESRADAAPGARAASRASRCAAPSSRCVENTSRGRAFASTANTAALTILQSCRTRTIATARTAAPSSSAAERGGQTRLACPQCRFVHWGNPVPVVAAVVERAGRVVLVHSIGRPPHWYGLVAGFLERGEHPAEAPSCAKSPRSSASKARLAEHDRNLSVRAVQSGDLRVSRASCPSEPIMLAADELDDYKEVPLEKLRPWRARDGTGAARLARRARLRSRRRRLRHAARALTPGASGRLLP